MLRNILLLLIVQKILCFLDSEIIRDYINEKKFKYVTVFTCNDKQDNVKLLKELINIDLLLSIKTIDYNLSTSNIPKENKHLMFILDGDCASEEFYAQCNDLQVFNFTHHWFILFSNHTGFAKLEILNLNINADVKVAVPGDDYSWIVYDVYKPYYKQKSALNISYYGIYSNASGLVFPRKRFSLYEERRNMSGLKFAMSIVIPVKINVTVEQHVLSDENRAFNHFDRMHGILMLYCGDFYNYSIKMYATDSWGYKRANNSFDGLVGTLQRREVDFGGSPIFHAKDRYQYVDYGTRGWEFRSAFLFRHPKQRASFEVFLKPLDKFVWISMIVLFVIFIAVLKFVCAVEIKMFNRRKISKAFGAAWSSLILFVIGALCQQGSPFIPNFISGRILIFFVFTTTVLLYQFYSGIVVSYLLMQPEQTIRDLRALSHANLKIGCEDVAYNREYFKKLITDEDIARLQHKTIKPQGFYMEPEKAIPLVAKGGFAYHVEQTTAFAIILNTFHENELCDLEKVPLFIKPTMSSFVKGSSIRDAVNHVMQKMEERGVWRRMSQHYDVMKPGCIKSMISTSSVGLTEFYPAFLIWSVGLVISVILLVFENIINNILRYYNN